MTNVTTNPVEPGGGGGLLQTPYYCLIRLFEYERPNPFNNVQETPTHTIILPLPIHLMDSTSTLFANQDMGIVGDIMNMSGNPGDLAASKGYRALVNSPGMAASLASSLSADPNTIGLPTKLQSLFGKVAGKAAMLTNLPGAAAVPGQISTAIEQTFEAIPNPNPTIKFTGPALRDFNFTWYINPKNKGESIRIKQVIQLLKNASLPSFGATNIAGILNYPHLCQINFFPWDLPIDQINKTSDTGFLPNRLTNIVNRWGWTKNSIIKIKRCFMTSVHVNYNPANIPAFYKGGDPVVYELSIQLKEVEYMTAESWGSEGEMDDTTGTLGLDLTASNEGSIQDIPKILDAFDSRNAIV